MKMNAVGLFYFVVHLWCLFLNTEPLITDPNKQMKDLHLEVSAPAMDFSLEVPDLRSGGIWSD